MDNNGLKIHIVRMKYNAPMCEIDGTYGTRLNDACKSCPQYKSNGKYCVHKILAKPNEKIISANHIEFNRNDSKSFLQIDGRKFDEVDMHELEIDGIQYIPSIVESKVSNENERIHD